MPVIFDVGCCFLVVIFKQKVQKNDFHGNNADYISARNGAESRFTMAKVFLVGIQDMNFPTRDGKGVIDGIALQCNYPDSNVIGLRDEICNAVGFTVASHTPYVQHNVELETNLKGKVVGISMAEE